jgi:hypothetical protein
VKLARAVRTAVLRRPALSSSSAAWAVASQVPSTTSPVLEDAVDALSLEDVVLHDGHRIGGVVVSHWLLLRRNGTLKE